MTDSLRSCTGATTARLHIRRLKPVDAAEVAALTDHPAILRALDFLPVPFTHDDALAYIGENESEQTGFFGGFEAASGHLAAVFGTHLVGSREVEIGYWVGAAYWGSGYAAEGAAALLGMLRRDLPRRAPFAECRPENVPSWKTLERIGLVPGGRAASRPGRIRFEAPVAYSGSSSESQYRKSRQLSCR